MGERLLCKQEVDGSIPFTSTTAQCAKRIVAGATAALLRRASAGGSGGSGEAAFAGMPCRREGL